MGWVVVRVDEIKSHERVESLLQQLFSLRACELNGFVIAGLLHKLHISLCYVFLEKYSKSSKTEIKIFMQFWEEKIHVLNFKLSYVTDM